MSLDAARGLLACPVCSGRLAASEAGAWVCPTGHSFDVARQGYLNLLGTKTPANADAPAMVDARDRFLATGAYAPIAEAVARRTTSIGSLLEVGAGTGYYLSRALAPSARGLAVDISPAAAKRSARADDRIASVVADVWKGLPVAGGRLGGVLCAFAPRNMAEFARVLGTGGLLVVVTPNEDHLDTVRERYGLMGIEGDKDAHLARSAVGFFEPIAKQKVRYTVDASADAIRDLIAMGPNAFHGVPEDVTDGEIHVSVTVHLFRKTETQRSL